MLSRDWSVADFVNLAFVDLGLDKNIPAYIQRFDILNKAIGTVANMFYDLMESAYMTPITIVPETVGRYYVSGASWTALTSRLTATMNTSFTSNDVEKVVVFRVNSSVYIAKITAFVSATVVQLSGFNLPTTDQTVNDVMVVSSVPTGQTVSIASVRIMRTGQPIKLELESTATGTVEPVTSQQIYKFDPTSPGNLNKIVYAYSGEELLLNKGNSLAVFGTLTMRYPRVPYRALTDPDKIDMPDGGAMEITFLYFKKLLGERSGKIVPNYDGVMTGLIQSLYNTFGHAATAEIVKSKVQVLK